MTPGAVEARGPGWQSLRGVASARLSGVKFYEFNATGYGEDRFNAQRMTTPVWFFLEPAVTVKVGYRWVKLFAQPSLAYPLNQPDFPSQPFNLVVGLSLDLAQWHGDWSF